MTASSNALLDPEAIRRLRELDPSGGNKLLERVVNAFSNSLERLLPDLARARDDAVAMQYLVPGWQFDPKRPCLAR